MIRVRQITDNLSYHELLNHSIIPDFSPQFANYPDAFLPKKYSPDIYRLKAFSFYGFLMDYIIRAGLRINLNLHVQNESDPVFRNPAFTSSDPQELSFIVNKYQDTKNLNDVVSSSIHLCSVLCGQNPFPPDFFKTKVGTFVNILKVLTSKWLSLTIGQSNVHYNVELSHLSLVGHPDILTETCVLDIKNTCNFKNIFQQSILQVLAYYSLVKPNNTKFRYVGFILPMQKDIVLLDLSSWDHNPYLNLLLTYCCPHIPTSFSTKPSIGFTISNFDNLQHSVKFYIEQYEKRPFQISISSSNSTNLSSELQYISTLLQNFANIRRYLYFDGSFENQDQLYFFDLGYDIILNIDFLNYVNTSNPFTFKIPYSQFHILSTLNQHFTTLKICFNIFEAYFEGCNVLHFLVNLKNNFQNLEVSVLHFNNYSKTLASQHKIFLSSPLFESIVEWATMFSIPLIN